MGEYQPLHNQDKDEHYSVFASIGLFVEHKALLWNAAGFIRELPFMSKLHIHCGLKQRQMTEIC